MPAHRDFASKLVSIEVEKPLGYYRESGAAQQRQVQEARAGKASIEEVNKERALKQRMAMGIAQSPAKTLAMQGFMMYMTGSSVSIISIMVVGMSLLNSFKSLLATNQCFEKLADGQTSLLLPKLLYIALNLVFLGMGLYKCSSLGLLPSTAADFVSRLPASIATRAEVSGVPL